MTEDVSPKVGSPAVVEAPVAETVVTSDLKSQSQTAKKMAPVSINFKASNFISNNLKTTGVTSSIPGQAPGTSLITSTVQPKLQIPMQMKHVQPVHLMSAVNTSSIPTSSAATKAQSLVSGSSSVLSKGGVIVSSTVTGTVPAPSLKLEQRSLQTRVPVGEQVLKFPNGAPSLSSVTPLLTPAISVNPDTLSSDAPKTSTTVEAVKMGDLVARNKLHTLVQKPVLSLNAASSNRAPLKVNSIHVPILYGNSGISTTMSTTTTTTIKKDSSDAPKAFYPEGNSNETSDVNINEAELNITPGRTDENGAEIKVEDAVAAAVEVGEEVKAGISSGEGVEIVGEPLEVK